MNLDVTPGSVRVRYAPSPTGKQHIGGARTALFNWAFARRHGGKFILRIEDTDAERSKPEHETAILEGLRWLGIDWDEGPDVGGPCGPYRQSERGERYLGTAAALFQAGWAYRCFCSEARLEELRAGQERRGEKPAYDGLCRSLAPEECQRRMAAGEKPVLRFRVPPGEVRIADLIRGDVVFDNKEVDDWVMVRSDGGPIYNFCVVVDDLDMRITHVLRGEEHLTNTPKQVLLYQALGLAPPRFGHLPLMLGTDGKKLSKRSGDTALQDYRDKGYPRAAIVNFLCLQGWALDGKTEIFSVDELVAHFDPTEVSKNGAIFDVAKFQWMAGEYARKEALEELAEHCRPYVVAAGLMSAAELASRRDWYLEAVRTERERVRIYSDLPGRLAYLFAPDAGVPFQEQALANARKQSGHVESLRAYLEWLRPKLGEGVTKDALREASKAWIAERKLKVPQLFQPLRCVLTGEPGGPDLFDVIGLLGPARALKRIEAGIGRLAV
jgi:nondiscriminating glutamyl-tRNA synthetase